MQKNWYIIYTKPKTEKKVSAALTRKKIENYVPLNSRTILQLRKLKIQKEPLFQNYIFVNISEAELSFILSFKNVINFVYWKQSPIRVAESDIQLIKEFTQNYNDIRVEKTEVNTHNIAKILDGSRRSFSGNFLTIKKTLAQIYLPTIGFSMTAKIDRENYLYPEIASHEKYLHLQ